MKASQGPFDGDTNQDLYIQPPHIPRELSHCTSDDDLTEAEAEAEVEDVSDSELTDGSSDNRTVQARRVLPKDKRLMEFLRRGKYKGLPGGLTYLKLAKKYNHSANNVLKQYRLSIKRVYGEEQGQIYLDEEAAERQVKKNFKAHENAAKEAEKAERRQKRELARAKKADTNVNGNNGATDEGGQVPTGTWLNARSLDMFNDDNHRSSYEQWSMPSIETSDDLNAIPQYQLDLMQHRREIEELLTTLPPISEIWESLTGNLDEMSAFELAFNHDSEGKDDDRVAMFDSEWPETTWCSPEHWRSSSSWWA